MDKNDAYHDLHAQESDQFYIWSVEHTAWWAPARSGYVVNIREAGKYSLEEIVRTAEDPDTFDDAMMIPTWMIDSPPPGGRHPCG